MTRIKLCGLSRPCDIQWANELSPEYIGFIFAERSHRYVDPDRAKELRTLLDPCIKAVGVFVDEDPRKILGIADRHIIDEIQLHGSETEEYINALKQMTELPVIKAFSVTGESDIMLAQKSSADYVLLDSGTGGTGISFDRNLIKNIDRPYFLAGGLDNGNVAEAVAQHHPFAVDVSSGIETDGKKDRQKMQEFVHAVRSVTGKGEER